MINYRALASLQDDLLSAVESGDVSMVDADAFILGFNYIVGDPVLDFIPDRVDITIRGSLDVQFETTVNVPFIHCAEDVDEQVRVNFEQAIRDQAEMSISDVRITDARSLQ